MMLHLDSALKRALRDNKNARLHILVCLLSQALGPVPIPTPASEIASELNLNRDTINDALHAMQHDGYAGKTLGGWIATTKARQLPLAPLFLEPGMEAPQSGLLPESGALFGADRRRKISAFADPMRKISASLVVVDQTDQDQLADQQQQQTPQAENFRIAEEQAAGCSAESREEVRAALKKAGIKPGRYHRAFMADPWVTVERVRNWQTEARRLIEEDGAELDNTAGYIIRRLSEHEEPPMNELTANEPPINEPTVTNPPEQTEAGSKKSDLLFEALSDLTGLTPPLRDWRKLTDSARGKLNRTAAELRKVEATPEQVRAFWSWWKRADFRGKQGQRPEPADVAKKWSMYLNDTLSSTASQPSRQRPDDPADVARRELAARINARRCAQRTGQASDR